MFSASGQETPCVGVSIGVERVFTIMERKAESMGLMQMPNVQVFVAAIGGYLSERMKIARMLWSANISAEYSHQQGPAGIFSRALPTGNVLPFRDESRPPPR